MSSSGNDNGNNQRQNQKQPVKITNPYAKKKTNTQQRNPPNNNVPLQPAGGKGGGGNPTKLPLNQQYVREVVNPRCSTASTSTSFSQAFDTTTSNSTENEVNSMIQSTQAEVRAAITNAANVDNYVSNTVMGKEDMTKSRENLSILQPHVLHVSTRQKGNGILRFIRNVPYAFSKLIPDYIFGPNRCGIFLSFKYHNLHPNYIHRRIAELRTDFDLRVLLCLVDVDDNASILLFLNKLCVTNNLTLILAWSEEEAARYLETLKAFEGKDASSIQKRKETQFSEQVADVLHSVRSVNKTDSAQLMSQFGSLKMLVSAPMEDLSLCPGIGDKKARRLYDAFHKPFSSAAVRKRKKEKEEAKQSAMDEEKDEGEGGDEEETTEKSSNDLDGAMIMEEMLMSDDIQETVNNETNG